MTLLVMAVFNPLPAFQKIGPPRTLLPGHGITGPDDALEAYLTPRRGLPPAGLAVKRWPPKGLTCPI